MTVWRRFKILPLLLYLLIKVRICIYSTGFVTLPIDQVTNDFPEFEKWGVFVFAGLVWVYLTARPGVLIGAIDAYVLGPAQKVFDGLSGRRNLKTSDFLIGDKLGEGSFGVVYSGVVVPKNIVATPVL
ncbi:putative non-specific serine/threonine protein kinase [Helianthus annuus]|nr:putative non-specific serine/threonine protein kinase [Helianthus annuus]KAJ0955452.1 putative non-specific serine/threonine protein kinase [Helianthus annuus]